MFSAFPDLTEPLVQPFAFNRFPYFIRFLLRLLMMLSGQVHSQPFIFCPVITKVILVRLYIILDVLQLQLHLPFVPGVLVRKFYLVRWLG